VIIFDNAGVGDSGGEVPVTIDEMSRDADRFIAASGLTKVDLLGFSMGGPITQQIAIDQPGLVRRLVLVGTGPRSGQGSPGLPGSRTGYR
jgi:pimeloyl-ACP methyl ester carboxylesterase